DARSDALQTTLTNEQFDQVPSGRVDLDLGSAAGAPGMIQNLAPSEGARAGDDIAGLALDLSTGEALSTGAPADFGSSGLVDLEVGHDAAEASGDEHVKVVG